MITVSIIIPTYNRGYIVKRANKVAQAKGKYIAFLDSNDLWPADFLKMMTVKLEQNSEYGIAYNPLFIKLYVGLFTAFIKTSGKDPSWAMPEPLVEPLCHLQKNLSIDFIPISTEINYSVMIKRKEKYMNLYRG
ncbi:MAG: hypothetical protein A2Y10_18655 [Planctomycetes bacterium GWF2_41_51]|nr:MAG: hypothetical protein A2Y10_18655 [Planctomycetes bacterium GWF2_41_51]HBG27131.1 hypothetical protein [Phycisphaerales bacterium]